MPQCAAKTKDGSPCQIPAREGKKYCHIHRRERLFRFTASFSAIGLVLLGILAVIADLTGVLGYFGIQIPVASAMPSLAPTPVSIPMNLSDMKVINTGLKGQICGYSKVPSVVRDMDGHLHVFFVTGDEPTTVFESISKDAGET